jgi:transmembrane sensor
MIRGAKSISSVAPAPPATLWIIMTDREPGGGPSPAEDDARGALLLARYVVGAATPEQRRFVEERLQSDNAFREKLAEMRLLWERAGSALNTPITHEDVDKAWLRLAAGLSAPQVRVLPLRPVSRLWKQWRRGALAASVLLAIGLGVWNSARRSGLRARSAAVQAQMFAAAPGYRLVVRLGDGSKVILAPGSRLRTGEHFRARSREVFLTGRAYFEIARDTAHPFRVHAGGTVTQVLGTKFDVRSYPGSDETEVVVRSGRVALRSDSAPEASARVLIRGQRGIAHPNGIVQVESITDPEARLAWTSGSLSFERAPLREVVPELERWFDLKIRITDPVLAERRITATFRNERLDEVLETIAELVDGQVKRVGKQVVFSPRRNS